MATPQRLPIVNSDDGVWGDILRQYLMKEHYNTDLDDVANGGHQTVTIRPGTAASGTAPLKFTSGTLMTTPEAGAMEFNNNLRGKHLVYQVVFLRGPIATPAWLPPPKRPAILSARAIPLYLPMPLAQTSPLRFPLPRASPVIDSL